MEHNFSQRYGNLIEKSVSRTPLPTEEQAGMPQPLDVKNYPTPEDGFIATYCTPPAENH